MTKDKKTSCKNYVGMQLDNLTVLEELEPHITPNGSKQRVVKVQCSCGNIYTTRLTTAKTSGKCSKCKAKDRRVDITGNKYGKLTVLSMAEDYVSSSGNRLSRCNCICDCGNNVTVNMSGLVTGSIQSCGCIKNASGLLLDNAELVKKIDFEKNKQFNINLEKLTARTNKKIWWKCDACGNSWFAQIASQNDRNKPHGCPYCSGRNVIKGKTDLQSQYPEIALEWDYEKNALCPDEISAHSSKKVWWVCGEGHSWQTTISNRVSGSGCPRCNIEKVNSFCEQAVYYYIKQAFPDAINSDRHLDIELDIYIPSMKVAIEYDGEAWHNNPKRLKNDIDKNKLCSDNNIKMIRIREPKLPNIDNCVSFIREKSINNSTLDKVIMELLQYLNINNITVNTSLDTPTIIEQYAAKKYNNSLAFVYPEIAKEWHPTKNGSLTPDKVNKASRYVVWWLGKCGHEWQMKISDRTIERNIKGKVRKGQGCPYCSGKRVLPGFNDLESQFPQIAKEWHPTKNGELTARLITPGSSKKIWWKCKSCGYEWIATPNSRCFKSDKCPSCYKKQRSPAVVCLETGTVFENAAEASKFANIKYSQSIYKCCRGEIKTAGGYHWKIAGESK